jgi:hypothetical protein
MSMQQDCVIQGSTTASVVATMQAGKGVDFIFGIKEGESGAELQAIRFKLAGFHCC